MYIIIYVCIHILKTSTATVSYNSQLNNAIIKCYNY